MLRQDVDNMNEKQLVELLKANLRIEVGALVQEQSSGDHGTLVVAKLYYKDELISVSEVDYNARTKRFSNLLKGVIGDYNKFVNK